MTQTVILAEDNPGHVRLIKKNLQRSSFEGDVVVASNGQDVLDRIHGLPTQDYSGLVVILDLNMPVLSGYKVLEQLKFNDSTFQIPVIVLTTTENPAEIERCYALRANWCMTKPVDYPEFKKTIATLGEFLNITRRRKN
jgi:CheY-like chemotaxis protein